MRAPWLHLSRWGWFAIVGALLARRDMCGGGGHPPEPPADAAPADAAKDGAMSDLDAAQRPIDDTALEA
ncbi:MAG: hypothetical protein ABJE95_03915 [Byssovorax sp.]